MPRHRKPSQCTNGRATDAFSETQFIRRRRVTRTVFCQGRIDYRADDVYERSSDKNSGRGGSSGRKSSTGGQAAAKGQQTAKTFEPSTERDRVAKRIC